MALGWPHCPVSVAKIDYLSPPCARFRHDGQKFQWLVREILPGMSLNRNPVYVPGAPANVISTAVSMRVAQVCIRQPDHNRALVMSCIGVFSPGAIRMRTTTMDSFSNSTTALAGPAGGIAAP